MEFIENLRKNKKLWVIIFCAALGVGLLLLGNNTEASQRDTSADDEALAEYSKEVEKKIYELCSRVKGVSNVSVAVSFESGFETVYARDYDKGDLLVIGSGSSKSAVKVTEKPPVINGIGVVCRGGGDPSVQKRLLDLLSAAFSVSSSKIYIAEAKK
jgi:stage III sporulation protein AG